MDNNHYTIIGAGGFAKEVYNCLLQRLQFDKVSNYTIDFVVDDIYYSESTIFGAAVYPFSKYDFSRKEILIAIAQTEIRKRFADSLEGQTFATLIHPSASVGLNVKMGEGAIITQNVVLTCDIEIGKHVQLNLNTTVGHDCRIGDFFTTAPCANISGNCTIGNNVYLATQAAVREKISITDTVIVGMGGIVVKDIEQPGTYVGFPAKLKTI